jgi:hypothetical protein
MKALAPSKVAVLLISPEFLASDFVADEELWPILKAKDAGLKILWGCLSACLWEATVIETFEAAHSLKSCNGTFNMATNTDERNVLLRFRQAIEWPVRLVGTLGLKLLSRSARIHFTSAGGQLAHGVKYKVNRRARTVN